jgi:hypothetical protein
VSGPKCHDPGTCLRSKRAHRITVILRPAANHNQRALCRLDQGRRRINLIGRNGRGRLCQWWR